MGSVADPAGPSAVRSASDRPAPHDSGPYARVEALRWGEAPQHCPQCGAAGRFYFLRPADGMSRRTRTGARSQRRVWKCATCRRQFTVLTATVLQGTRIDLSVWVAVLAQVADDPSTVPSAAGVAAEFALGAEAAALLVRRVTAVLALEPVAAVLDRIRSTCVA